MAWNPSPKVADCRTIARKWGYPEVIIIALDEITGQVEMATYGETRKLCASAKDKGDAAFDAILAHAGCVAASSGQDIPDATPLFGEL